MYVYFIRAGDRGAIKIGVAGDVKQRLEQLQIGNAFELKVLTVIPCTSLERAYDTEKRIHKFFASQRIRGEWFHGDINFAKLNDMRFDCDVSELTDQKKIREFKKEKDRVRNKKRFSVKK